MDVTKLRSDFTEFSPNPKEMVHRATVEGIYCVESLYFGITDRRSSLRVDTRRKSVTEFYTNNFLRQ